MKLPDFVEEKKPIVFCSKKKPNCAINHDANDRLFPRCVASPRPEMSKSKKRP